MQLLKMNRVIKIQLKSKIVNLWHFCRNLTYKKNCVGNHQAMNILSNFDSRKTEYREMIGSSVQDFGSFYQKPLEPIFTKDARQPLWFF